MSVRSLPMKSRTRLVPDEMYVARAATHPGRYVHDVTRTLLKWQHSSPCFRDYQMTVVLTNHSS